MKLEVGMYVRTKYGISQYKYYDTTNGKLLCIPVKDGSKGVFANIEDILKASDNIIDLIEVGDYVNGERVIALKKDISERNIHMNSKGNSIFVDYDLANDWYYGIDDEDIKSIVTKEQMEQMAYKVGE